MNSLTYLSRQFDVLASTRTPPSTPVSETVPSLPDPSRSISRYYSPSDGTLKRVKTSLDLGASSNHLVRPKRSASSPSGFGVTTPPRRPSAPAPVERPIRSKSVAEQSPFRRIFFVRVFVLLCNAVYGAWTSVSRRWLWRVQHEVEVLVADEGGESDDKDSEDESRDERRVLLQQPSSPSPLQPPLSAAIPHPPVYPPYSDPSSVSDALVEERHASRTPSSSLTSTASEASYRSSTHTFGTTRKTPLHLPKTLVLDLDETLIHSTSRPMFGDAYSSSGWLGFGGLFGRRDKGSGKMVEVVLGGRSTLYHVYKRPFVDYFLRKVSGWYTLVIFTASMQEYADPVIDWLDAGRGILARRLFREACTQLPNGTYTKDLSVVEQDLARVFLVDNSPISYNINEANGIPIEGWTHDPNDEALLDLLPVLDSLRFTSDVRRVLGIRGFS